MTTLDRILVATALDRRDHVSVRHAARLAHAFHTQSVVLAHVEPPHQASELHASVGLMEATDPSPPVPTAEARLLDFADTQRGAFPVATQVLPVTRYGSRVAELLKLACEQSSDLIVVARRPRDEHDAVSDAVVKLEWKAPCSLLVVPEGSPPVYERILVACDFSDHSLDAVRLAARLARWQPRSTLTILHVYSLPSGAIHAGRSSDQLSRIMASEALARWQQVAANIYLQDVPHTFQVEEADDVPATIQRVAVQRDAQLVVVGSHGRTAGAGMLLGHVADRVCAQITRPFLCVKRKGEVVTLLEALLGLYGSFALAEKPELVKPVPEPV